MVSGAVYTILGPRKSPLWASGRPAPPGPFQRVAGSEATSLLSWAQISRTPGVTPLGPGHVFAGAPALPETRAVTKTEAPGIQANQTQPPEDPSQGEKKLLPPAQGPFFYIGGTNGAVLISSYCRNKGWQRIHDNRREDYKLKWCETKCRDTYYSFREGEQLLYQIPNNKLLTTKIGLLNALREYARVVNKINKSPTAAHIK
uniref:Uncharacterized protein n=1 Tax=Monodelphis domestica TaxID=13616 RepID=F6RC38_MONDO